MQSKEILEGLNEEQRQAVMYNDGPLLLVAGAGTGKTKVIISKIAYLISEKIAKPSEVLAITFTKKAAAEMEERLDIVLPYGYNDVKTCNFHSLAEEFLRENAYSLGYSTNFKILTEPQQILFIRDRIFDFNLNIFRPLSDPTYFIRDMVGHFSRLKDELISPEQYIEFAQGLENKADSNIEKEYAQEQMELARAYKTYQEFLALNDRMDFGDLIYNLIKALKEKEQLLSNFRKKYRYILVDEFQDTNKAQNELLKLVTTGQNAPVISVVGDDDQSIYKFRGADISNILEFKDTWSDVRQIVLTQNYRNTQKILDSSYQLIKFNDPDRLEAKYGIDKKLKSNTKMGDSPKLLFFENATQEASAVAEEIERLRVEQGAKYSDFAILVRSNSQAQPFLTALGGKKIPYIFSGNEGLFRKSVIKNVIAFFSILVNPGDNLALFNLLVGEFVAVDFDRLSIILHKVRSKNIYLEEYLREEGEVVSKELGSENAKKVNDAMGLLDSIRRESITASAGEVLYRFVSESGYLRKLATEEKKGDILSGEKIVSISHFFDKILGFQEANLDVGIQKFMEYLNLLLEIGEDPSDEMDDPTYDAVKILTVHGSKGLEFKYVFMVGLSDSRFPSRNMGQALKIPDELLAVATKVEPSGLHLQEERRLFYVGMTRAAERLYFTFGRDYGGKRSVKVSRFVVEAMGEGNVSPEFSKQTELERIAHFAIAEKPLYSTRLKLKEEKLRLSRAEVDDYLTCPRKYKFVHITPIKLMTDQQVIFGRAVHKVIEEYYKSGKKLSIDQMIEIYKENWSSEGFISAEHERKRYDEGMEVIRRFYGEFADRIEVFEVEKPFKFEIENNIIEGRIDALERLENGGVGIIDFKTSRIDDQKSADNRARDNTQLGVYALAILEMTGKMPERVGLFFLMNGIVGEFVPTESSLEKVREKITKASNGIRSQEFGATPSKVNCENCSFSRYCDDSVA